MSSATHSRTRTGATPSGDDPTTNQRDPSVDRETAGAIATLLRRVRPAWDQLATLNAVADASREHRDLADLVAGSIRIAEDDTARTPRALGQDGFAGHWRRTATPTRTSGPARNESCPVRGHEGYWAGNCPACRIDQKLADRDQARREHDHPPARYHHPNDE